MTFVITNLDNMHFLKSFGLFLFVFLSTSAFSNDVYWSTDLDFQHNEFAASDWSAKQALGRPNAQPYGQLSPHAFRLASDMSFGTLVVNFDEPHYAQQVLILESYLPGRITDVSLYDEKGKKYSVYKNDTRQLKMSYRMLCIKLQKTSYKVKKVEVNLSTVSNKGWSQIDAIGIANVAYESTLKQKFKAMGIDNFDIESSFSSLKENLGESINTNYSEIKPLISPDGKTLFFSRKNYPGNVDGKEDEQDIYFSTLKNGRWQPAKNIGSPLNNKFPNGVSAVSTDGNKLVLINHYDRWSNKKIDGVSISTKRAHGWGYPRQLNIADYYNRSKYADFYLSNNGKHLLLAIDRSEGVGGQDLYVSHLIDETHWSKPHNLGYRINTERAEFAPFLASDDMTLYFASNGHGGYGSSDIFYTKRIDDTWKNWTKPTNLGSGINTAGWDAYYSMPASGDYAYFVQGKGTMSDPKNIFRIALPQAFKPEPMLLVKGKILNSKTKEPIAAEIDIEQDIALLTTTDPLTGRYSLILKPETNYRLNISAKGYKTEKNEVHLCCKIDGFRELEKNIYLTPLASLFHFEPIYFEEATVDILAKSRKTFAALLATLKKYPTMKIKLSGHTDSRGNNQLKYDLSKSRALKIRKYLMAKGIDGNRIMIKGLAGTKPVTSNDFEISRKLNRRVEIEVLSL